MKTKLLLFVFALLALAGCENKKRIIVDFAPIEVLINVVDAGGASLLNPTHPTHLDLTKIKATHRGQEYKCNEDAENIRPGTKDYMPYFYGLKTDTLGGEYLLTFGEFDATLNYDNEKVTILWPDGSSDSIVFSGDANNGREWFLNGVKVDMKASKYRIKIVK